MTPGSLTFLSMNKTEKQPPPEKKKSRPLILGYLCTNFVTCEFEIPAHVSAGL